MSNSGVLSICALANSIDSRMRSRRRRSVDESKLAADVDRLWLSNDVSVSDGQILERVSTMTPQEAAIPIARGLDPDADFESVVHWLNGIGIATGDLSANLSIPRGVYAIWRTDYPLLLVEHSKRQNRGILPEITEQVGYLIYGEETNDAGEPLAQSFALKLEEEIEKNQSGDSNLGNEEEWKKT